MSESPRLDGVVDSHCHLQSLDPDVREAALDEARERGVVGFLMPAIRLAEAEELLELCERHADVWCALGTHPHDASSWQEGDAERLRSLLVHPKAVAVGECGLDFHYDLAPREQQGRALREQWEVAIDLDLPVIVHNRESNEEMLQLVREPQFAELRADFHSYSGGVEMARELIERDFYLGFSGMVTFKRADNVREILPLVPDNRILVETDTPYLAPTPHRGKPNKPGWVVEVALRVADELSLSPADFAKLSSSNFRALFAVELDPS
ncbi:MAG: TatD family hydrolase [Thermoanaerobaculia bacterium]|nr:TatD family hydrolase [Thermoanaerobaculia bacterium]